MGAGCWVLGAGCWVLDAGCWVLGAGCWVHGCAGSVSYSQSYETLRHIHIFFIFLFFVTFLYTNTIVFDYEQ
jgi:hypothetical protein